MSSAVHAIVLTVFILASCIWVGGYIAIAVVARVASATLDPQRRIVFFQALGRSYLRVGLPALVVALAGGAALLSDRSWDGLVTAAVALAAGLLLSLAWGVKQARHMSRIRASALADPADADAAASVLRGARAAAALRAFIGLISIALVVIGAVLAS